MPYRYPPEFRRKVLNLVATGRSVASIAADLGVSVYAHGATSWVGSESYANWGERHEAVTQETAEERMVPHVNVPQRFRGAGMSRAGDPPAE
jgi:transposase-like protein